MSSPQQVLPPSVGTEVGGIVDIAVGWLGPRTAPIKATVPEGGIGLAGAVEVVLDVPGPRDRPVLGRSPPVSPHDEHPHRRLIEDARVEAAKPVVEPAQLFLAQVDQRLGAEVHVAGPALGPALPQGVDPGTDQDLLTPPRPLRAPVGAHTHEVVQGPLEEDVVPAAEPVGRHLDVAVGALDVAEAVPVGAEGRMADPLLVGGAIPAGVLIPRDKRQVLEEG